MKKHSFYPTAVGCILALAAGLGGAAALLGGRKCQTHRSIGKTPDQIRQSYGLKRPTPKSTVIPIDVGPAGAARHMTLRLTPVQEPDGD